VVEPARWLNDFRSRRLDSLLILIRLGVAETFKNFVAKQWLVDRVKLHLVSWIYCGCEMLR
jgi:hypothetical protein